MTRINPRFVPPPAAKTPSVERPAAKSDPLESAGQLEEQHTRQRQTGRFPALQPADGSREAYDEVPKVSARALQRGAGPAERPDLSGAQVFGRPVDPRASHDLFWHYFGGRASPQTNDEARVMMAEMAEKFAPFGFTVTPVEHERMDKVRITGPDGKTELVDFIFAMGGQKGQQRLQWLSADASPGPRSGGGVSADLMLMILKMFPPTNDGLEKALEEIRKQKGYENTQLLQHPTRLDKLKFDNGLVVDVIIGAGGPNPQWGWQPE